MSEQPTKQIIESNASVKTSKLFLWIIGIALAIMALVFGNYFFHFNGSIIYKQDVWGQFGDYIGGTLNPILSFLSLIALLWTIGIQSKDLELTRDELKRSAKAQEDTKAILDKQSEVLARQQFESTFFQLLLIFNEIVQNSKIELTDKELKGKRYFIWLCNLVKGEIVLARQRENDIKQVYRNIYEGNSYILKSYFQMLYSLIKFIDACKIKGIDKQFYNNLIRAQLSKEELYLLYLNTISLVEYNDFEDIMANYKYWDDLKWDELIDPPNI